MNAETTIADGVIEKTADGKDVIRFERRIPHPVERVWAALTEPDQLRKWWGEARLELVDGGEFQLQWLNTDEHGNAPLMRATITDLQPPRVLETRGEWGAGGESVAAELRWELAEHGDATVLRFTNTVDSSGEAVTGTAAGWHYHLDALAAVLDGGEVDLVDPSAPWEPIHEAYERREREG